MARAAKHNALAPWSCSAPARSGPSAGSAAPGRHQNRDPPAQPGILVSGMRHRTLAPADNTSPRGIVDQSAHLGPATAWAVAAATRFKALASDAHVRETSSRARGAADPFAVARGNVVAAVRTRHSAAVGADAVAHRVSAVGILTRVKSSPIASNLPLPQVYTSTPQDGAGLEDDGCVQPSCWHQIRSLSVGSIKPLKG
ncbi:hypothetical protein E5D57_009981 [Metarhizium anisopliae]|nr:hypothetical protein E5D57_009981 [Metarhizium anisopliae]